MLGDVLAQDVPTILPWFAAFLVGCFLWQSRPRSTRLVVAAASVVLVVALGTDIYQAHLGMLSSKDALVHGYRIIIVLRIASRIVGWVLLLTAAFGPARPEVDPELPDDPEA